ncbi:hypothetical protein B0T24DRAFT_279770 [Lasiosphaeria ovina]|uniref:Secreted protein n=1 Tax=Lasiosphaeria ovina TaxID=92902 RepID=A0AAE0N7T1_9PEZI|nr:hypothetical protein B0T24DRAFT_279770 [Lasiosphaeria ovina]
MRLIYQLIVVASVASFELLRRAANYPTLTVQCLEYRCDGTCIQYAFVAEARDCTTRTTWRSTSFGLVRPLVMRDMIAKSSDSDNSGLQGPAIGDFPYFVRRHGPFLHRGSSAEPRVGAPADSTKLARKQAYACQYGSSSENLNDAHPDSLGSPIGYFLRCTLVFPLLPTGRDD